MQAAGADVLLDLWLQTPDEQLSWYRRAQWAPVRVEVELRRLQAARPELGRLVPLAAASAGVGLVQVGSGGETCLP